MNIKDNFIARLQQCSEGEVNIIIKILRETRDTSNDYMDFLTSRSGVTNSEIGECNDTLRVMSKLLGE